VLVVNVPALPTTPTPIPPTTLPRPITTFASKLQRTPDGNYIVGVITPTAGTTYIFVYEVASGIVLRNRTVSGASSVLSMAPDGTKFMTGLSLMDISTLQVIAAESNANAPFPFTSAFNTQQNVGGSIFAPDGSAIYAAFNTAPVANPPVSTQASTLLVNDPSNLAIRLGIKLPESIVAKIVMKKDGSEAWGLSDSGMLHLPLGNLYTYPILMPQTNTVFLSMDDCNRGVASATLKINNAGQGKLTYTVSSTNNAALIYQQSSGLAPSAITFTMEPGRTGVTRQAGTNIWSGGTGVATVSGTPFTVTLASPDAINLPPAIRVYMNYRQPDQRGVIFPIGTTPNNSTGTNSNQPATTGNEGLQDLVLDEARGRLYITNSGFNRIEVFDTKAQQFLNPIPVGQLPHSMAMGTDGNTLYVGNTGGESISMVDLNLGQVINNVIFPPTPRNGTSAVIYPKTLGMGLFGLQFVMSSGTSWQVVNNTAVPRSTSTIIPVTMSVGTTGPPSLGMMPTPGDDFILTLSGDGHAYLYDATNDAYVSTRFLNVTATTTIQGYYGPLGAGPGGAYYLVDGMILSPSLTTVGGSFVPSTVGAITPARNVAAVAPVDSSNFLRLTTPIRTTITQTTTDDPRTTLELVNLANGTDNLIGVVPEQPLVTVLGTARYNAPPRTMVVDKAGTTAYALTISGLSVIALAPTSAATQPVINPTASGILNVDGTANITPGSFIVINGQNLAASAKALTVPPPTVLGGSCVTFGDIASPLLLTSSGQIQAQVPPTVLPGTQIVEVRSLATAQDSLPVAITVKAAGSSVRPPGSDVPTESQAGRPGKK
jgi:hypothetical protein